MIDAMHDDVVCGHGVGVGGLNLCQLFGFGGFALLF